MGNKNKKELILSYWVNHTDKKRHYFDWSWSMIWVLIKYKIWLRMDISFTVTKAIDREEYHIEFYAE